MNPTSSAPPPSVWPPFLPSPANMTPDTVTPPRATVGLLHRSRATPLVASPKVLMDRAAMPACPQPFPPVPQSGSHGVWARPSGATAVLHGPDLVADTQRPAGDATHALWAPLDPPVEADPVPAPQAAAQLRPIDIPVFHGMTQLTYTLWQDDDPEAVANLLDMGASMRVRSGPLHADAIVIGHRLCRRRSLMVMLRHAFRELDDAQFDIILQYNALHFIDAMDLAPTPHALGQLRQALSGQLSGLGRHFIERWQLAAMLGHMLSHFDQRSLAQPALCQRMLLAARLLDYPLEDDFQTIGRDWFNFM